MNVRVIGNPKSPLLVCLPGLMGDVSDFNSFIDRWQEHFQVVLPSIEYAKKEADANFTLVDSNDSKRLLYENTPHLIAEYLKANFPGQKAYFAGISIGGKITLEIAGTYPELFAGAVVSDAGLGPLCNSGLFDYVNEVVANTNLDQSWPALRQELESKIPDRMIRLMIQSQLEFSESATPKGKWRPALLNFPKLVTGTTLDDQWRHADKITRTVHILKATSGSMISDEDYVRMQEHAIFQFHPVEGGNHFLQIHQREVFASAPIDYLLNANA